MLLINVTLPSGSIRYDVTPDDLARIARSQSNAAVLMVQDNFRALGGRKYWSQAADATTGKSDGNVALITVSKAGVRLRWQGGMVRPGAGASSKTGQPTRLLAIPAFDTDARPGEFKGQMVFLPCRGKGKVAGILVEAERRTGKRGKNKGKIILTAKPGGMLMYRLVTSTDHDPNPAVMPTDDALLAVAAKAAETYINLKSKSRK